MGEKIDLLKKIKSYYAPATGRIELVDIPAFNYLMIDGHGDPNHSQDYQDAVSALFSLAYAIKFAVKKSQGVDYGVMPAEGLWWVADMAHFNTDDKSSWDWTMMILQPEFVSPDLAGEMRKETAKKKKMPLIDKVRFESYHEGLCAQMLHIGPYAAEGPNIARLHAFIEEQGGQRAGKHHEIYLSDVRKTAPEKLRTILRQPMRK